MPRRVDSGSLTLLGSIDPGDVIQVDPAIGVFDEVCSHWVFPLMVVSDDGDPFRADQGGLRCAVKREPGMAILPRFILTLCTVAIPLTNL